MPCDGQQQHPDFIYIPLCLYLYDEGKPIAVAGIEIYIPLCLYLYHVQVKGSAVSYFHLHSTMFIFIYIQTSSSSQIFLIYIPLCLYLYSYGSSRCNLVSAIYIPLCLYLYLTPTSSKARSSHLHSTMFIFISYLLINPLNSHSIYIPLCLYLYQTQER